MQLTMCNWQCVQLRITNDQLCLSFRFYFMAHSLGYSLQSFSLIFKKKTKEKGFPACKELASLFLFRGLVQIVNSLM
jgi:hypothetical protein